MTKQQILDKTKDCALIEVYKTDETKRVHTDHIKYVGLGFFDNSEIDVLKTISMLLIHDLVEVYAGDTYAYDEEGKKTQKSREEEAAVKLYGLLPEDQKEWLTALWKEFEAGETPEARFAHTMDNFQPVMLNAASAGKDRRTVAGFDTVSRKSPEIRHGERFDSAPASLVRHSLCQRMFASGFRGYGGKKKFVPGCLPGRDNIRDDRRSGGHGSRLVQSDGVDLAYSFESLSGLEEDAVAGSESVPDHYRHGRGESESARA